MDQDYNPKSHSAALATALLLAITASNNEQAAKAEQLCHTIAARMNNEVQFEAVKDAVEACINYFNATERLPV